MLDLEFAIELSIVIQYHNQFNAVPTVAEASLAASIPPETRVFPFGMLSIRFVNTYKGYGGGMCQ